MHTTQNKYLKQNNNKKKTRDFVISDRLQKQRLE